MAVNYVDRYLHAKTVDRKGLQLVGTAALFVAAKTEECKYPTLLHFANVTDSTWEEEEINKMSITLMHQLKWDFHVITPASFLMRFIRAAQAPHAISEEWVQDMQHVCEFFCDVAVIHSRLLVYTA